MITHLNNYAIGLKVTAEQTVIMSDSPMVNVSQTQQF